MNENRGSTVMGYADEGDALEELFCLLRVDRTAVYVAKSILALWGLAENFRWSKILQSLLSMQQLLYHRP